MEYNSERLYYKSNMSIILITLTLSLRERVGVRVVAGVFLIAKLHKDKILFWRE
jgi:hypothetical protein